MIINIRLGLKLLRVVNTLAYNDKAKITTVKSFIVHAPRLFPNLTVSFL